MAQLNFNALAVPGPSGFSQGFTQGRKEKTASEMDQLTLESGQFKMDELKRDRTEMLQLQEQLKGLGQDPDLNKFFDTISATGNPKYVEMAIQGRQKLKDQLSFANILGGGVAPQAAPQPQAAPSEPYPGYNEEIGMAAPANALAAVSAAPQAAPVNAMAQQPSGDMRAKINQAYAIGTPEALAWAKAREAEMKPMVVSAGSSVFSGGQFGAAAPAQTPTKVAEYNFAKTPEGGGYTGSYQQFIQQQAAAGRAPAQPRAEQPPVAVVDPVTGKPVYVSRERAIGEKMSPATAQESLTPKEIQKREAVYPQATSAVKGFETKSEGFIKDLIALRDHPGLGSITGIAAGRMPGITGAGRAAQALFDKAVAKGGFQALQDMRDASKTGGALGSVSNQEGKQLTASFAAINRTQDAKDVRAAIDQAIGDLQGAKVRTREAYDLTYGYKQGSPAGGAGGAGAAAVEAGGAGVDSSNPLLQ
jgi:hypothetical protein